MVLTVVATNLGDLEDPKIQLKINHILKGPPRLGDLTVRFQKKDLLPQIGSRCFVFIDESVPSRGAFEPTEGNDGIIAINELTLPIMREFYPRTDFLKDGIENKLMHLLECSESAYLCFAIGEEKASPSDQVFNFQISEVLKGVPLARRLPIRYLASEVKPERNSRWIMFLPEAVPKNGAFETLDGSEGRIPASEENLNCLYRVFTPYASYYGPHQK